MNHRGLAGCRVNRPHVWPLLAALVCLGPAVLLARLGQCADQTAERRFARAVLIPFEGPITPLLEQCFYRKLEAAKQARADLVIVEIDSPGGLLETSQNIAERLRNLSWARTAAFIPREALSGAAIVALGCDEIVMAPEARLGDAGPIFQGEDNLFRHAPEKIRSDLARRMHDLAKAKGRPPALAEAMVDMDLIVYYVRNKTTGEAAFLSQKEIDASVPPDQWEKTKPVVESGDKRFLTVNGQRAMELRLAEGNASSRTELVTRYGLAEEPLVLNRTGVDTAVIILNLPLVTGLLFVVGLVALYVEFSAPGIGMGGLVAGLCFAMFFWSRFLGGTAGWLEVILFAAGVCFLAVEVFVLPGFGIAGLSGLLLIFASILMASQGFVIPRTTQQLNVSVNALLVLAVSSVVFVIVAVVLSQYFNMLPVVRSLILDTPGAYEKQTGGEKGDKGQTEPAVSAHRFPVGVGDWGIAESPLRPAGKVRFAGSYVDVVTDGSFVEKGKQVRVIDISGNRVVVREIEEPS